MDRTHPDGAHRRPRWVVVLAALVVVGVLAAVVAALLTGGEHGPGRHTRGAGPVDQYAQFVR